MSVLATGWYFVKGIRTHFSKRIEDPQDALKWLWDQAEDADEDAVRLKLFIDGVEVKP